MGGRLTDLGVVTLVGGTGDGQFAVPFGIAVGSGGDVFVADAAAAQVQQSSSGGVFLTRWGVLEDGDRQFDHPWGVTVAPSGSGQGR